MRIVTDDGQQIAEISPFPGCNQIAVSHSVFNLPNADFGFGHAHMRERLALLKSLGYDVVVCTVLDDNVKQEKILMHAGWIPDFWFFNKKTHNGLRHWHKNLGF